MVGRKKFTTLVYADDLALMTKTEEEIRQMIGMFGKYMEEKKIVLDIGTSKILVFKKEGKNDSD